MLDSDKSKLKNSIKKMGAGIGVQGHQFSLSWSRIAPTGDVDDVINEKAVTYYNKMIDLVQERGISPIVTLHHYDLPQALQDKGGIYDVTKISKKIR